MSRRGTGQRKVEKSGVKKLRQTQNSRKKNKSKTGRKTEKSILQGKVCQHTFLSITFNGHYISEPGHINKKDFPTDQLLHVKLYEQFLEFIDKY
jgi:uncharacterized protein YxeA